MSPRYTTRCKNTKFRGKVFHFFFFIFKKTFIKIHDFGFLKYIGYMEFHYIFIAWLAGEVFAAKGIDVQS